MAILDSPSSERNKEPILGVLSEKVVPLLRSTDDDAGNTTPGRRLVVLEVAAGAGVHTQHFASNFGETVQYYPSDPEEDSRASIAERASMNNLQSVIEPPLALTLCETGIQQEETDRVMPPGSLDLIICINMIHISPWGATFGLMKMASAKLRKGGMLYCYGPYKVGGTAVESNL